MWCVYTCLVALLTTTTHSRYNAGMYSVHAARSYETCSLLPLMHQPHVWVCVYWQSRAPCTFFTERVLNHNGICNIVNKECETQWLSAVHYYWKIESVKPVTHTRTGMHSCRMPKFGADFSLFHSVFCAKNRVPTRAVNQKKVNAKINLIQFRFIICVIW